MTTKLKIDLSGGILEVEGSEAFVRAIYKDFKLHFIGEEAAGDLQKPKRSRRSRTASRAAKAEASASEAEPAAVEAAPQAASSDTQPQLESSKGSRRRQSLSQPRPKLKPRTP